MHFPKKLYRKKVLELSGKYTPTSKNNGIYFILGHTQKQNFHSYQLLDLIILRIFNPPFSIRKLVITPEINF